MPRKLAEGAQEENTFGLTPGLLYDLRNQDRSTPSAQLRDLCKKAATRGFGVTDHDIDQRAAAYIQVHEPLALLGESMKRSVLFCRRKLRK